MFNHSAFRMRSKKRLDDEVLNGEGIVVEGLYTKQSEGGRFRGNDVFDGKMVTLAIDGQFMQGIFYKMGEVKVYFYSNTDFVPTMISLMRIQFSEDTDISVLASLNGDLTAINRYGVKAWVYTFCVNTVLDDLDMVAAKLVSL